MFETELIKKIQKLKEIKPREDWVLFTKSQLLGTDIEVKPQSFQLGNIISVFHTFFLKPAYAGLIVVFVFFGLFGVSQNSLPGDSLYLIKKIAEKSQAVFVSDEGKTGFQLKLANDRLEDLTKAPVKNLAPTINEFQANISEAARNLAKLDATTSSPVVMKKIIEEAKKIEENKQKVEALGVVIGEEGTTELSNALAKITGSLIEDLENQTLNVEKEKILDQMKELFAQGKYSEALELYLINQ